MIVGLAMSCDGVRLKKILNQSMSTMSGYWGLTREDKEDILIDVAYRFEVDKGRFPDSVYQRHCHNKIVGFLGKKTAKKRMAQKEVDGKAVYIPDISLNAPVGDDGKSEKGDFIPAEDSNIPVVEYLADMEIEFPHLAPLFRKALNGIVLSKDEKKYIKKSITREDINRCAWYIKKD